MEDNLLNIPESPNREEKVEAIVNSVTEAPKVEKIPTETTKAVEEDKVDPVITDNNSTVDNSNIGFSNLVTDEKITSEEAVETVNEFGLDAPSFQQEDPVFSKTEDWDKSNVFIFLPSVDSFDKIREIVESGPNINLTDTPAGQEWLGTIEASLETMMQRRILSHAANRKGSDYRQKIPSQIGALSAGVPNISYNTGDTVTGEKALFRIRSLLGQGSIVQIPLYHSGFWLTIKAPSDGALLELERKLVDEKISLGRNTHGFAFANTSVFITTWLVDFIFEHIYDNTIKGNVNLRKAISVLDLPTIFWGLAVSVWPSGFAYSRACVNHPDKCQHIVKEKLNLSKIHWPDLSALTERQISHMTKRGGSSMTPESVDNYTNEFLRGKNRVIGFGENDKIKITLRVPSIEQHIDSGHKWINDIVETVDKSLTSELTDSMRNVRVTDLGKSTNMRQYVHWVEKIDMDGLIVDDPATIEKVIDQMSSDDDIRAKYFDEVIKFIDDSTIAVVAIPNYECPECNTKQLEKEMDKFPYLIPIDVMNTFFILLMQKIGQIRARM